MSVGVTTAHHTFHSACDHMVDLIVDQPLKTGTCQYGVPRNYADDKANNLNPTLYESKGLINKVNGYVLEDST